MVFEEHVNARGDSYELGDATKDLQVGASANPNSSPTYIVNNINNDNSVKLFIKINERNAYYDFSKYFDAFNAIYDDSIVHHLLIYEHIGHDGLDRDRLHRVWYHMVTAHAA